MSFPFLISVRQRERARAAEEGGRDSELTHRIILISSPFLLRPPAALVGCPCLSCFARALVAV